MKRIALTLAIAAIAVTAVTAVAPGAHAIGVYGIYWNPKVDQADNGYGAGLKYDSKLTPFIHLDGRFSYIHFSNDAGSSSIIPFEATACVQMGTLYGGVGVGYYTFGGDNAPDNDFGWYLLAGISILPGPVSVFGEFKWQNLEPADNLDLESYVFHVGATFGK
ncbi:MAG TPA: hypothetical protein VFX92_07600 [Candidatus Krumholzibacteria bacterium]|nr:hypothetical protein [Candidatus Krumholzibacteria bacterium]